MVAYLFIISLMSLWTPGDANEIRPRPVIVGGTIIKIEEAPFMAIYKSDEFICGASILNERFVLSAAHCYRLGAKEIVTVGTDDITDLRQNYPVEKSIVHPKYNPSSDHEYDVLVLKLTIQLTFSEKVQPIMLADTDLVIQSGTKLETFGFGKTCNGNCCASRYLRTVEIPYVNLEECKDIFTYIFKVTNTMICAGELGKDSCWGDSGGPLVYNNILVGVVSFGYGCGIFPGVYASVSALRDFIDDSIMRNS